MDKKDRSILGYKVSEVSVDVMAEETEAVNH
jgi:hypothetical protein